jgi:hypothetical protein
MGGRLPCWRDGLSGPAGRAQTSPCGAGCCPAPLQPLLGRPLLLLPGARARQRLPLLLRAGRGATMLLLLLLLAPRWPC